SALAKHFRFAMDIPFARLPKKIQQMILYGSDELIKFHYQNEGGHSYTKRDVFEGVIPNMERRYRDTESEMVREELSKYLANKKCESCHGARLSQAARFVFVTDKSLPEIAALSISQCKSFFENLKLAGYRAEIAVKIVKELI